MSGHHQNDYNDPFPMMDDEEFARFVTDAQDGGLLGVIVLLETISKEYPDLWQQIQSDTTTEDDIIEEFRKREHEKQEAAQHQRLLEDLQENYPDIWSLLEHKQIDEAQALQLRTERFFKEMCDPSTAQIQPNTPAYEKDSPAEVTEIIKNLRIFETQLQYINQTIDAGKLSPEAMRYVATITRQISKKLSRLTIKLEG